MLYFDANATTPCELEVQEAMRPYWSKQFANASSTHWAGRAAANAVTTARKAVAACLEARPKEIVFTSGATESINLIFWGMLLAPRTRNRVVVSSIEHKAVLESAALLGEHGYEVIYLSVTRNGVVDLKEAADAITEQTALVSIQAANNELGTVQPIKQLIEIAHQAGAFFHVDAVQALGKIEVSMQDWGCDFASFSAHKIYGPKGVGALYIHGGPQCWPWPRPLRGGNQEGGLRPGTLNVPGIIGFGAACNLLQRRFKEEKQKTEGIRNFFEEKLREIFGQKITILGEKTKRLPNTSAVLFTDIDSDILMLQCRDMAFSNGSACTAGSIGESHVIKALPEVPQGKHNFIRFSFLESTTEDDVKKLVKNIHEVVACVRY